MRTFIRACTHTLKLFFKYSLNASTGVCMYVSELVTILCIYFFKNLMFIKTTIDSNTNRTALHLLVDIVSTYEQQQEHGVENDLFQEGLKKAIYAISAAARGNIDVQNSLMDQMDGNGLAAGRSLFLNSLYNISMSTNRTHAGTRLSSFSCIHTYIHTYINTYFTYVCM